MKQAASSCPSGEICLWREKNYNGVPWRWSPSDGTRALPRNMLNHVYSFYASASGCFIDSGGERRRVSPGHFSRVYNTNFGTKVDTIAPFC
ncbi:peptidase inhibitor family I36 protein [Microbispora bryophytorum]|uniref:peptidase inhibitor family I36 protein n=1 Tax=Microbispora bryophytorum TaxID=1460882 RepID=UPI0033D4DC69